ncbi:MAG: hypothetical protein WD825_17605 [Gemmatimonadaceae bacterium]
MILACHHGFLLLFVGGGVRYWKELVIAIFLARALRLRGPTAVEIAAAAVATGVFLTYQLLGATAMETLWGAKLLLLYAAAGWAVARLARADDLLYLFDGLAVAVASNVVIAVWQRSQGVDGLMALGIPYGSVIREAGGALRAFGALTYGAPFAYTLAIAMAIWLALFSVDRMRALAMAWVPAFGLVGITLSLNRIAVIGLCAAGVALMAKRRGAVALLPVVVAVTVLAAAMAAPSTRAFFIEGLTFSSASAGERSRIWEERWGNVTPFGHGPSSAGAAFERAAPPDPATSPVVDNLYLSWLYQYGLLFGVALAVVWVAVLLAPMLSDRRDLAATAAALVGVFAAVSSLGVNVWEEFPVGLIIGAVMGVYFASKPAPTVERLPAVKSERDVLRYPHAGVVR